MFLIIWGESHEKMDMAVLVLFAFLGDGARGAFSPGVAGAAFDSAGIAHACAIGIACIAHDFSLVARTGHKSATGILSDVTTILLA